jgi:hypothetical protein
MLEQVDKKTSGRWPTIQPAVIALREHHQVITNLVAVLVAAAEEREVARAAAQKRANLQRAIDILA